jgi:hypothetical protein
MACRHLIDIRKWLTEIETGTATIDGIAAREACSKRHVSMTTSLAFLAPGLVKAAGEGHHLFDWGAVNGGDCVVGSRTRPLHRKAQRRLRAKRFPREFPITRAP